MSSLTFLQKVEQDYSKSTVCGIWSKRCGSSQQQTKIKPWQTPFLMFWWFFSHEEIDNNFMCVISMLAKTSDMRRNMSKITQILKLQNLIFFTPQFYLECCVRLLSVLTMFISDARSNRWLVYNSKEYWNVRSLFMSLCLVSMSLVPFIIKAKELHLRFLQSVVRLSIVSDKRAILPLARWFTDAYWPAWCRIGCRRETLINVS